jgi:hypothetical protein
MKTSLPKIALLTSLLAAACAIGRAQPAPAPVAPAVAPLHIAVVVSEALDRHAEGVTTFAAIQTAFTKVLGKQGWPATVSVERFASNNPDYDVELRVFFRGIYYETPGELTVRAWMTLFDHGKEHDFGIIKFQLVQGPIEHRDDAFEVLLRGEAEIAAAKIGPILFPSQAARKN